MNAKKASTPENLLRFKLAERPQGTRCVLVAEPDGLIDWGRTQTDRKGREWAVVIYRGDDVVTRRAWQRHWGKDQPICLVLTRSEGDESMLQASSMADLVSRAEGDIIDLSLPGYFSALFPKINPPPATLAEYRREFIEHVEGFQQSYPRFKERWGEPDTWSRAQFLAILLLARVPALKLEDLWCDHLDSIHFGAHALWLLCHPLIGQENLRLAAEVVWESSRQNKDSMECRWLAVPGDDLELFREEAAAYLVLRDILAEGGSRHVDALLRGKLLPRTIDPVELGVQAPLLLAKLKEHSWWPDVRTRAQGFLSTSRMEKVADLLSHSPAALAELIASPDTALPVLGFVVRQAMLDRFQHGRDWPVWMERLLAHPLLTRFERGEFLAESEQGCAALLGAANSLEQVERSLATAVPVITAAEQLLDWYVNNKLHLLEYRVAEGFARLEAAADPTLLEAGSSFVMKAPAGLRQRVRDYLQILDQRLADFIRSDPQKFMLGPRSAIRIIPDLLGTGKKAPGRRVWVLVMDGMRYDTWDAVARPLLLEHFEVVDGQDKPYFSLLPSKTDIARCGLLAGGLPRDWKNYLAKPTKDERVLAARALGVPMQDFESKMAFVTDAETTKAREKLGYSRADTVEFNVLIYPISDDLGHHHSDTLASLNDLIRQQLRTRQGRHGIVDDLRKRVQPGDLVLVTSDHGFQELFPEESISVSRQDALNSGASEDDVAYRYLRFRPKKGFPGREPVVIEWEELNSEGNKQLATYSLPVGSSWFKRERGKPACFAHGGISLAEMTIPGVLLRPITEKAARIEFLALPGEMIIPEDESQELAFELVNSGNVEARFELAIETNLRERLLDKTGSLLPGKHERFTCTAVGRYQADNNRKPRADRTTAAVFLTLVHSDLAGKMIRPGYGNQTVHVTVKPRPTKIDTDALKAFDDL